MDITLASDANLDSLQTTLLRSIQQNLIPILAGCGASVFLDPDIDLILTNSIVNGWIRTESIQNCDPGSKGGVCQSYLLVLDLYLKGDELPSSANLVDAIENQINREAMETLLLASEYPIETVFIPCIVPSGETLPPTSTAPTESPTTRRLRW